MFRVDAGHACKFCDVTLAVFGDESDNCSRSTRTCGTARSMEEGFVLLRWVRMDHEGHVVHVNTACGDVGGNQCVHLVSGECSEVACADRL